MFNLDTWRNQALSPDFSPPIFLIWALPIFLPLFYVTQSFLSILCPEGCLVPHFFSVLASRYVLFLCQILFRFSIPIFKCGTFLLKLGLQNFRLAPGWAQKAQIDVFFSTPEEPGSCGRILSGFSAPGSKSARSNPRFVTVWEFNLCLKQQMACRCWSPRLRVLMCNQEVYSAHEMKTTDVLIQEVKWSSFLMPPLRSEYNKTNVPRPLPSVKPWKRWAAFDLW